MSYSMRETLTISLPAALRKQVANASKRGHLTKSEFVRKAIQEKLWEDSVDESVRRLAPKARALGIRTDDDVFERLG
jgi:metal-responsive CopG/Arc/MetJ family transcriptional regulator